MNAELWPAAVFWLSCLALVYTFAGYPLLVALLARFFARPVAPETRSCPQVSVVLAAHNEAPRILPRLENLFCADYPREKLQIVVVSDGSTDQTVQVLKASGFANVLALDRKERAGKAACLNAGIAAANGEIIVLCDVRQRFEPDTISRLVAHFADEQVGAVSGSLEIESASSAVGGGVDAYWRLEKFLRFKESQIDSSIGCTGAVYAIRKNLFVELPADTLLDDVVIPMQLSLTGHRILFDPKALAHDPQSLEPHREKVRKQRTLAGNYQMLFRYPGWLLPWNNRLWWQLLSHKYLRLLAPFTMAACLVSNVCLVANPIYRGLLWGQGAFYMLALLGGLLRSRKIALLSIPAGFVFLNLMSLVGLKHYLRKSYRQGSWPVAKS
jgi:cellulose synthase/poly-beta-1,6-N-acetylglucosamine synthase-like glycosyltransferase